MRQTDQASPCEADTVVNGVKRAFAGQGQTALVKLIIDKTYRRNPG